MLRRRRVGAIALVALLLAAFFTVAPHGRTAVKSLLLIPEVLPDAPLRPLSSITGAPIVEEVRYSALSRVEGGEGEKGFRATVYRPAGTKRHGAVILSLGVNPDYSDPTFLRLVDGLARSGVVAMAPEPVRLDEGKMALEDVKALAAAFEYLAKQPYVDSRRVGYAGFCVGASLVTVAAQDPRIARQVRFLSLLGPYYDIFSLMEAINNRSFQHNGADQPWQPEPLVEEVFARHLIDSLSDPEERSILEKRFVTKESEEALAHRLSEKGAAVYKVLSREDPSKLEEVINNFPSAYRMEMEQLSPKSAIGNLRAKKVFILHDRNDSYIPFVESRRFFQSLLPGVRSASHYTESELFKHMHPTRSVDKLTYAKELSKLYRHLYLALLEVM